MNVPTVCFFHQLVSRPRPDHAFFRNAITPDAFRSEMVTIQRKYNPIGIEEFHHHWRQGTRWPKRSVMITFDDGFANNMLAARILRDMRLSAVFFVLSDVVDSDFKPWYIRFAHILSARTRSTCTYESESIDLDQPLARRRWLGVVKESLLALPPLQRDSALDKLSEELGASPIDVVDSDYHYMTGSDLRELVDLGMTLGCHSASHDNLARCNDQELHRELVDSKERLAELCGRPVEYLSYPDGRFNEKVVDLASKHYGLAFAASPFYARRNPWCIPRRNADAQGSKVLGRFFPYQRRAINLVKRGLRWN